MSILLSIKLAILLIMFGLLINFIDKIKRLSLKLSINRLALNY